MNTNTIMTIFIVITTLAMASSASSSCSTDHDCSLNGNCVNSRCECDKPWIGEACDTLDVKTSFDAYRNQTEASWGGNVVHVNGTYHLFVAQMAYSCGLDHYGTNSQIIRATSTDPQGPYTFRDVVVEPFAHNPTIRELPNDTGFVIFFIGGTKSKPVDCRQHNEMEPSTQQQTIGGAIHVVYAKTVHGPWSDPVEIMFTENASIADSQWGHALTNPSPYIHPDGTVTLALQRDFKKNEGKELIGVARSETDWKGPYTMLTSTPIEPEHWYCVAGTGEVCNCFFLSFFLSFSLSFSVSTSQYNNTQQQRHTHTHTRIHFFGPHLEVFISSIMVCVLADFLRLTTHLARITERVGLSRNVRPIRTSFTTSMDLLTFFHGWSDLSFSLTPKRENPHT